MKEYKNPFCIRHDYFYCPLPLTLESYWACEADCFHCPGRKLNAIWGQEQRVSDYRKIKRKLINSLNNKQPSSDMAVALSLKKTFFIGRKADPYQPIETKEHVTRNIIKTLNKLDWSHIICSRYTDNMLADEDLFAELKTHLLIEITPGGENDRVVFERERTPEIEERLRTIKSWIKKGFNVGVRGEPFIPGFHTPKQFREMLKRLKAVGVKSYNTYNLHLNDHVAKRLHSIKLDLVKIWEMNQDINWKPIQRQLCEIADEENMILGCPDFVNTGKDWIEKTNTCCGIDVPNPFRFNTHHWKRLRQKGKSNKKIFKKTWENIGDKEGGKAIIEGRGDNKIFTLKDVGI